MTGKKIKLPDRASMQADILWNRLRGISMAVQLAYTSAVEGDVAEFGTGFGYSFQVIAGAMREWGYLSTKYQTGEKKLLGFDSFVGFPKATHEVDVESPMVKTGTWGEGRGGTASKDELLKLVSDILPAHQIQLYEGWYSDTLKQIPKDQKFALVHLDCDLYESTSQVLSYLFANDHLSDGCQLLFDDFLENRMSPNMGQRKAWLECVEKYKPKFTDLGFYGQPCWRCAIHRDINHG